MSAQGGPPGAIADTAASQKSVPQKPPVTCSQPTPPPKTAPTAPLQRPGAEMFTAARAGPAGADCTIVIGGGLAAAESNQVPPRSQSLHEAAQSAAPANEPGVPGGTSTQSIVRGEQ